MLAPSGAELWGADYGLDIYFLDQLSHPAVGEAGGVAP